MGNGSLGGAAILAAIAYIVIVGSPPLPPRPVPPLVSELHGAQRKIPQGRTLGTDSQRASRTVSPPPLPAFRSTLVYGPLRAVPVLFLPPPSSSYPIQLLSPMRSSPIQFRPGACRFAVRVVSWVAVHPFIWLMLRAHGFVADRRSSITSNVLLYSNGMHSYRRTHYAHSRRCHDRDRRARPPCVLRLRAEHLREQEVPRPLAGWIAPVVDFRAQTREVPQNGDPPN